MFPLGHIGITLGLAVLITHFQKKEWDPKLFLLAVAGGALLPDLIDKPVGFALGYPGGGRLVAHSLLFALVLTSLSFPVNRFLKPRFKSWDKLAEYVPFIVFGMWIHLVLDRIWEDPETFLWPAYGWSFPTGEFDLAHVILSPVVLGGEIVGGLILVCFGIWYFRFRKDRNLGWC